MALFDNRKAAARRKARRKARNQRQKARQTRRQKRQSGGGLITGIGSRKQARQKARQDRRALRIKQRTKRTQAKAAGGKWDPESVSARWEGIASVTESAAGLGEHGIDAYTAAQTGGLSSLFGDDDMYGSGDVGGTGDYYDDDDVEWYEDLPEWAIPAAVVTVVAGVFLLSRKKK